MQVSPSHGSVTEMSGRGGGFGRMGASTGGAAGAASGRGRTGGGGGGGGWGWGGFGAAGPVERVPKERRGRTIRRIVAFFKPYKAQVGVVLVAILLTSFIGLI